MLKVISKTMKSLTRLIRLQNWPELSRYCCCNLSTGIYIRSVLNLVIISVLCVYNGYNLSIVMTITAGFNGITVTVMGDRLNKTVTEDELLMFRNMLKAMYTYIILWFVMKCIYVLSVFTGFYAIFYNKATILKFTFKAMAINWIFDIIVTIAAKPFTNMQYHVLFLVFVFSELYNLIAINSKYKQMAFKSQIVPQDASRQSTTFSSSTDVWNPSMPHGTSVCSSNFTEIRSERTTMTSVSTPQTPSENFTFETASNQEEKALNFKDGPIIFNQEVLQPSDSLFANTSRGRNGDGDDMGDGRSGTVSSECLDMRHSNRNTSRKPKRPSSLPL